MAKSLHIETFRVVIGVLMTPIQITCCTCMVESDTLIRFQICRSLQVTLVIEIRECFRDSDMLDLKCF